MCLALLYRIKDGLSWLKQAHSLKLSGPARSSLRPKNSVSLSQSISPPPASSLPLSLSLSLSACTLTFSPLCFNETLYNKMCLAFLSVPTKAGCRSGENHKLNKEQIALGNLPSHTHTHTHTQATTYGKTNRTFHTRQPDDC